MGLLEDMFRDSGFLILGWYFSAVLAGAVLQGPLTFGGPVPRSAIWRTTGALLAFGLVLAGLAIAVEPIAPLSDVVPSSSKLEPELIYPMTLFALAAGPAALALGGWVLPESRQAAKRRWRDNDSGLERLGFMLIENGGLFLLHLLLFSAIWHLFPSLRSSPDASGWVMLITLIASAAAGGTGWWMRRR